ncbi:hypothetical protein DsansV1_C13g0124421 [Dioscorea sansibarensis]
MEKPGSPATAPLLSRSSSQPYYAVPAPFQSPSPPAYVLLPSYHRRRSLRHRCRCCSSLLSSSCLISLAFVSAIIAASLFFLWPSDPEVSVTRFRLQRIHVATKPTVSLGICIGLEAKVRNRDFFSLDYDEMVVAIGYRGRRLGSVRSEGGHIRARGVSYIDAVLRLDGIRVLNDVFYLIEDLARGSIPFDTVTEIEGHLHLFFLDVPIQGNVSCEVHVNPKNQTVIRQNCYPEVSNSNFFTLLCFALFCPLSINSNAYSQCYAVMAVLAYQRVLVFTKHPFMAACKVYTLSSPYDSLV